MGKSPRGGTPSAHADVAYYRLIIPSRNRRFLFQPSACRAFSHIPARNSTATNRSEEHTSELQSRGHTVCRLLLEKKKIVDCHYPYDSSLLRSHTVDYYPTL